MKLYYFKWTVVLIILTVLICGLTAQIAFCSGAEELPSIMQFKDLHMTESFKAAKSTLKGASGIYCFTCTETGSMYIGSSIDIGKRLVSHILNSSTNSHLQYAIAKYGLSVFIFSVIELVPRDQLLIREQYWLDWYFVNLHSFDTISYLQQDLHWVINTRKRLKLRSVLP